MEISKEQLSTLLEQAATLGAIKALASSGATKPFLKKSEAYRLYGRSTVERWFKEGLLTPIKDGSDSASWRIDRVQIESVAMTANRMTYLTTTERQ